MVSATVDRRRWAAALFALGLIVASCTSVTEETEAPLPETLPTLTPTTEAEEPEPEAPETSAPDQAYLWSVGDCVDLGANAEADLPYAPYGLELLSDCTAPHTHEVYFTATLDDGAEAPYPADLNERLFDRCFAEFASFMGFQNADSTLDLVLYLPDEQEWAAGERYHACVLYQPGTSVIYRPLVGSAGANAEPYRWEVSAGTCYDLIDLPLLAVSDAVDCANEHGLEVIGNAPLVPSGAGYPGRDSVAELAGEACDALLTEYAVQPIEDLPLATLPLPTLLTEGEWDSGKRTVRCFVLAGTPERGLLIVKGSLGDGTFEIVGSEPDDGQVA